MEQYKFITKFSIGEYVYHAKPDGDKGIIIDINYNVITKSVSYHVIFGRQEDDDVWCDELELSEEKVY